ncbi:MAG TPA: dihydrolipoamide acetyltransferase family protein [Terriglobales bacterium]|jgi:pyruvate dehydrogenase E2 component (dihydrolipoamide acetyltransferase)|nr:dihydrolipoamide acetyltransferase family protein [Terriglobales bacterium]
MSISIVMPQLGLTMTEGTVSGWLKKPGDFVKKNEPLLSVSTDKVEMEVESLFEGTLGEIIVPSGETVPVGTVLAYLEGGEEDMDPVGSDQPSAETLQAAEPPAPAAKPMAAEVVAKSAKSSGQVSPRAKRLAKELGVDLSGLKGSGSNGEVVEDDIRKAGSGNGQAPQPNLRRRQLIATRLTQSIQTIPTFSVAAEANAEKLLALHQGLRKPATADGVKLTITDLLLTIFAAVLKASPDITSTWENNVPRSNASVDIGLAVATPEGVVAPVLKSVDTLDLNSLVAKRHTLADKARQGKLALGELEGGVSTLSNLGMYRVDHFEALIAPGQSSILAVGSIKKRPWVEDEKLVVKSTVLLNFTVDHRIADGAAAASFLGKLVELIEEPSGLKWPAPSQPNDSASRGRNG